MGTPSRKPGQPLSDDECKDAITLLKKAKGNQSEAARLAGLPRPTFYGRLREAESRGFITLHRNDRGEIDHQIPPSETDDGMILPDLPHSELPARELIKQASARFTQHLIARETKRWFEIKAKTNKPIGVVFMGDPHIDSPGCNWPLLERDIGLLENTEGLYCVNLGDLTDNWVGRLQRLYADSEMTKKQAWKLVAWFLKETKIKWLCILLGNHDLWNDGPHLIKANAPPKVPVEDWQARFQIVFPNDRRIRIHVAHNFPGSSVWNPQHGPQKASMLQEEADIFACGDKHTWYLSESENAQRRFLYWLIRCRGYKFIDPYGEQLGYGSQDYGASVTAVIDPTVSGPARIRCFPDLEQAAAFLTYLRGRS